MTKAADLSAKLGPHPPPAAAGSPTGSMPRQADAPAEDERYRELLENANDVVYTHDLQGNFTSVNHAGERIYGYPRAEFLRMQIRAIVDPAHLATAAANIRKKAEGGEERTPPYELLTHAKDGHDVWVEVSTRIMKEGGKLIGIQGIARDVTDRHLRQEAEMRLREQEHHEMERLAELDRFKSDFLRMAAHELGTPLTPILLEIRTLRQQAQAHPESPEFRSLSVLDRNLGRLSHLVQDMLQAARLQSGRLVIRPVAMDLANATREAVETYRASAAQQGIELTADVPAEIPIMGDPDCLAQVIGNLVSNAIKYTHSGGWIRVAARVDPEEVRLVVTDTGLGFTEQQARLLFQPFMQIHEVLQRNRPGTGLGLYICKGVIEQHGGTVGCQSPGPGMGAQFWFAIPRAPAHDVEAVMEKAVPATAAA